MKNATVLLILLLALGPILPAQTVVRYTDATGNIISAGDNVNNALRVNLVAGSASGVTHTDDAAFTVTTDDGVPIFGMFDDAAPDSVNEGDAGVVRMSANRNLYVTFRDAAGNERGANVSAGNALLVDASATTQPVSGTVTVGTFPDNEPFNVAQINGVTPLMGNGVTGTGSLRVTIASDNTAFAVTANHANTTMGHGVTTVTTAGTDVALAGSTAAKYVTIQAQTDNTSWIAVGATGVDATIATGNGVLLAPGDSVTLRVDNLADVFIDSLVNGEGVRYNYQN